MTEFFENLQLLVGALGYKLFEPLVSPTTSKAEEYLIAAARGASPTEALVEAGAVRLRPILMTTLCTLFGLLPLALGLGAGAELQKPLAIAVIGGLSVSTVVTLVFVPTVLSGIYRRQAAGREAHETT